MSLDRASLFPPARRGTSRLRQLEGCRAPQSSPPSDQQAQCCHHTPHPAPKWCQGIMLEDSQTGTLEATTSTSTYHHIGTSVSGPSALCRHPERYLGHHDMRFLVLTDSVFKFPTSRRNTSIPTTTTIALSTRHHTSCSTSLWNICLAGWRRLICVALLFRLNIPRRFSARDCTVL